MDREAQYDRFWTILRDELRARRLPDGEQPDLGMNQLEVRIQPQRDGLFYCVGDDMSWVEYRITTSDSRLRNAMRQYLESKRELIDKAFGEELTWGQRHAIVATPVFAVGMSHPVHQWNEIIEALIDHGGRLFDALQFHILPEATAPLDQI